MKKINVLVVDDHRMVREGIRVFLEDEEKITVKEDLESLKSMFEYLASNTIDVLVIDFKLKDGDGINGAIKVKDMYPHIKTILITAYIEPDIIYTALSSNIDGIIFKSIDDFDLAETIIKVYEENYNIFNHLPKNFLKDDNKSCQWVNFTTKEEKILNYLSLGRTNAEIASELKLAEKTVRNYIYTIFKKIHVSNRTEAAAYWIKLKMTNRDK